MQLQIQLVNIEKKERRSHRQNEGAQQLGQKLSEILVLDSQSVQHRETLGTGCTLLKQLKQYNTWQLCNESLSQ